MSAVTSSRKRFYRIINSSENLRRSLGINVGAFLFLDASPNLEVQKRFHHFMKALLALFCFFSLLNLSAQTPELDSLENTLRENLADSSRIKVWLRVAELSRYSDADKMYDYSTKAKQLANTKNDKKSLVKAYFTLSTYFESYRNEDSLIYYFDKTIHLADSLNDKETYASVRNAQGLYQISKREFETAIETFYEVMRLQEEAGNTFGQMAAYNNIGLVFMELHQYQKAIDEFQKALALLDDDHPFVLNNVGSCYGSLNQFDSAIHYTSLGLARGKETNNLHAIANGLHIQGDAYQSLGDYEKALSAFLEAEEIRKKVPNPAMLVSDLTNISSLYAKLNQPNKGLEYGMKALELAQNDELDYKIENIYQAIAENYEAAGNYRASTDFYKKWAVEKDSSYAKAQSEALAEQQTRFETEKKEQQIALQAARIAEQEVANQRNIAIILGLTSGIILLILFVIALRSSSRKKQALIQQEAETKLRETQIEAAISSQERERSRFAKDLHDGFGQMISILNLNLKSLEDGEKDKHTVFESSSKVLEEMYQELKGICFNLMPQTLIKHGVTAALDEFAARVNAAGKLQVETDFFGLEERLSDIQEISLYRISQEWVNNVIKYSHASKVTIQITRDVNELTLLIEDDGTGFNLAELVNGKGNGWRNMNSRANLIKGELEVDTTPNIKGNALIVNVPTSVEETVPG
ncbi:MAG: hypothetical protein CMB80_06130 [Flammeovirgaceae bacterium]|nr:hypothetical protein [Flammeovirgaceae bacterium]MBE62447.1 hypothetical protein [Flammeovirgaceae bacterium]HCX21673.1 hypothetical protein [Cytophagales bacterium]|tara:strand:- start:7733 stop:9823 length:2091 start_codon:yes stop_codon:yes gene_type:complete